MQNILSLIVLYPALLNKFDREKEAKEFLKKCEDKFPSNWRQKEIFRILSRVTLEIQHQELVYSDVKIELEKIRDDFIF